MRTPGLLEPPTKVWPTPSTAASFWGEDAVGGVVDLRDGERVGREGEDENRRVCRVDFAVGWVAGQVGGQLRACGGDGGLDVACGTVDVAREVELHGDRDRTLLRLGGHLVDAGDTGELALQRRRDGACHRLRVGSGQTGTDGDDGELDFRQGGCGQELIGNGTGKDDGEREQECGDRAADERRGEVDVTDGLGGFFRVGVAPVVGGGGAVVWGLVAGAGVGTAVVRERVELYRVAGLLMVARRAVAGLEFVVHGDA